jgi:hypothetical protein
VAGAVVRGKIVAEHIRRTQAGRLLAKKHWGKIPAVCIRDAGKKKDSFLQII